MIPDEPVVIDMNRIEERPGPYCMSFGFDVKPLISSIEAVGLVQPPFVVRNKEGLFDPVTGYRRLRAMKELRRDKVPCMDLSNTGLSPMDLLLFNLHDNLAVRILNTVEKGMVVGRLRRYIPVEKIRADYTRLLQLTRPWDLDVLLKMEELPEDVKTGVADGSVSINSMGRILEADKTSFVAVLNRMVTLKLNMNQQAQFIDYIIDISIRENRSINHVLNDEPFLDLLNDKKTNSPQKAKKTLDLLKRERFPFISSCESSFKEMVARLNLPPGVRIQHPPFFESAGYRLEILFKDGPDLNKKIHALSQVRDIATIKDPWEKDA